MSKKYVNGELVSLSEDEEKAIQEEAKKYKEEYKKTKYTRDRGYSYPHIQEQLDMIYWDKKNGTKKWEEATDKVKTDHPKPE